jgi:hypothetical protein
VVSTGRSCPCPALLLAMLLALTAVVAATTPAAAAVPDPVARYAPLVWLHPDEAFKPGSADAFVRDASLSWSHDSSCGDHQVAAQHRVNAHRLGSGGYRHQIAYAPVLACRHHGRWFRSNERVRPRDGVAGGEGFFLNFPNALRGRGSAKAPVYYDYRPGHYVTYWFFYAFNDAPTQAFDHEGDWEQISVRLDARNRATAVAFFGHGSPCTLPIGEVHRRRGHPVVFSANGTHASYWTAGSFRHGIDQTGRGTAWRTWQHLRNVRARPWFGYGGAWGEVGAQGTDTTGPLGPSRFKAAAPADWSNHC